MLLTPKFEIHQGLFSPTLDVKARNKQVWIKVLSTHVAVVVCGGDVEDCQDEIITVGSSPPNMGC